MNLSFKNIFFALGSIFLILLSLIYARTLLIPIAFALLISFILLPLVNRLEKWGVNRIMAAIFSLVAVILILTATVGFISSQLLQLSQELTTFQDRLIKIFTEVSVYFNEHFSFLGELSKEDIYQRIKNLLESSAGYLVGQTFSNTASFVAGLVATVIYAFLILIYRKGLTNAVAHFYTEENRPRAIYMFKKIQQVGQKYLVGMLTLIIIIGVVNSVGLWIIGVDSPFLFGFLGALLSVIPYVGTVMGAVIPILYVFIAQDSLGKAIAVAILFWAVQLVTDNFLSPKIVGGNLRVNALAAILSLIIGALVWGVAGMILFLPFTAMLLIVSEEFKELKPLALMIGTYESDKKAQSGNAVIWIKKIISWAKKVFTGR
ncbi:AI-2E family transporter [Halocola ammonii]